MAITDAVEGLINSVCRYHYDLTGDVLYLRNSEHRETAAFGEETLEGLILLRDAETDRPVGLTIVNWWARFGQDRRPDSLEELGRLIEPWAARLAG